MTQPAGSIARGITAKQSFYLRASPVLCVADALVVVAQLIQLSIKIRSLPSALGYISRTKCQDPSSAERNIGAETTRDAEMNASLEMTLDPGAISNTETTPGTEGVPEAETISDGKTLPNALITAKLETAANTGTVVCQLKSLQENDVFRGILFIFGVLPQLLKLYTCTGIPGFQVLASMYLVPWVVLELLVVLPARYSILESSAVVNPNLAYINKLDDVVIWICYLLVHYSDIATKSYLDKYLSPNKTWQISYSKPLTLVVWILKTCVTGLFFGTRLCVPSFYPVLLENIIYIPLVFCLARPGLLEAMWLLCLRAGRFVSMHGLRERGGPHFASMTTPSFQHQSQTASIAFFLMQVVTAVGSFCTEYDPTGTSKPSWA
ncbi:MAG: hypothetical protein L6R39_000577 [Caloplaca ligustica]|nr:MAG: hypothetical protein L6R39_000577 [Caloplaca ligustica]